MALLAAAASCGAACAGQPATFQLTGGPRFVAGDTVRLRVAFRNAAPHACFLTSIQLVNAVPQGASPLATPPVEYGRSAGDALETLRLVDPAPQMAVVKPPPSVALARVGRPIARAGYLLNPGESYEFDHWLKPVGPGDGALTYRVRFHPVTADHLGGRLWKRSGADRAPGQAPAHPATETVVSGDAYRRVARLGATLPAMDRWAAEYLIDPAPAALATELSLPILVSDRDGNRVDQARLGLADAIMPPTFLTGPQRWVFRGRDRTHFAAVGKDPVSVPGDLASLVDQAEESGWVELRVGVFFLDDPSVPAPVRELAAYLESRGMRARPGKMPSFVVPAAEMWGLVKKLAELKLPVRRGIVEPPSTGAR